MQDFERFTFRALLWKSLAAGLLLTVLVAVFSRHLREFGFALMPAPMNAVLPPESGKADLGRQVAKIERRVAGLQKANSRARPRAPHLVIDTSSDRFKLVAGDRVLREGICSTGSYVLLTTDDSRQWMFRTPRGMFRVQNKLVAPVWKKPDWAFVEEGLPVPPAHAAERFERGVLGAYGMSIGNGYLIHGTLYQRYLGMPVTHGCVRLADEDLESVYRNLQIGSQVFIY